MINRWTACPSHGLSHLGCLTHLDRHVEHIFSASRHARDPGRVQSVPKNDGVDDLATTGAAKTCDADLTRVILKVLECRVGELWHQGRLIVAVEHYVTQLIQQKIFSVMNQLPVNEFGPRVLIGCPEGESHEIGAQSVAYLAAARGCHVYYLGPNLPSSDLLAFCDRIKPDLVLLSITEIKSDAEVRQQLKDLAVVSAYWPIAVGGQGARAIGDLLHDTKIELLDDLTALHSRLMILLSTRLLASRG